MSLITRTAKGSKLTIQEMDGNLTYLESNGFVDGKYSQISGSGNIIGTFNSDPQQIFFANPIETGATGSYTVSPTGGSGTGAEFELVVIESRGAYAIDVNNSSVTNGGINYEIGEQLTVPCSSLGGTTGNVVFTLSAGSVNIARSIISVTPLHINLNSTSINLTNLPTTDPTVQGQLWNDSGSLKISAGA